MPYSDTFTHPKMIELIKEKHTAKYNANRPMRILDCGVGSGLIGQAIKVAFADKLDTIELTGLEVHPPYINDQAMKTKVNCDHTAYKEIITGDPEGNFAVFLAKARKGSFDVIIFGDSLEHVYLEWAEHSMAHAIRVAKELVIVNTPIEEYEQEESFGNPWEKHCCFLSQELLESWGGKLEIANSVVGCYSFAAFDLKETTKLKTKEL